MEEVRFYNSNLLNISFLATGSLSITISRTEVVSFLVPLDVVSHRLFIKNPSHVYNYTAYLEPLTFWSWVSIGIFLLIAPILLFIMARLVKEPDGTSIIESYEAVYVPLIAMGSQYKPSYFTTRVIFGRYHHKYYYFQQKG